MIFLTIFITYYVCVESNSLISLPSLPSQLPINPTDLSDLTNEEQYSSAWERSGLFEGDIVTSPVEFRNVLISPEKRWPLPVPVFINRSEFDINELRIIDRALAEIEERTCVRFRQYMENDLSFIIVKGNQRGCWSSVGRQGGGQIVHLQRGLCVDHSTVVHEFLHALGLYHQQSSPDRDNFIRINWQNIKRGEEHNFKKYGTGEVTTYNLPYDYKSIMHYTTKAFSSNGLPTITPLDSTAKIGLSKSMSESDAKKIRYYYNCQEASDEGLDYGIDYIYF